MAKTHEEICSGDTMSGFDDFNTVVPREAFPAAGMTARAAQAMVNSFAWTDANPMLNLSSFVTTFAEPEAVEIIEVELRRRGIRREEIDAHADRRSAQMIPLPDGTATPCSFCDRPAIEQKWGLHRLWGLVPVFPRFYSYCEHHLPKQTETISEDDSHPLE